MQGEQGRSTSGRKATPTRTYLLRFALAVVAPLLVFVAFLLYEFARDERGRAEQRAMTLALHISRIVDAELARLLAKLDGLAASQSLEAGDYQTFLTVARRAAAEGEVIVLREPGPLQIVNTFYDWGRELPTPVPMSERQLNRLRSGSAYVGNVFSAPRTGEARVAVARSVNINGRALVLALAIPTTRILNLVQTNGEAGWIVGVGDASGVYVTRSLHHEEVTGKPGDETYIAKATGPAGAFYLDNVRGRPVLAGYANSPFSSWLYAANIDYADVVAPQRTWLAWLAVMAAATLATSVAAAYYFGRKYSEEAARLARRAALAAEGGPAETGGTSVAEFAVIAEALTRGQEAMAERERERERSREREAFLASIFDSTGLQVGIVELDEAGARIILANKSAMRLFGAIFDPGTEGAGRAGSETGDSGIVAMMKSAQQLQVPVEGEFHLDIDGRTHHFLGTFTRLENARIAFTCVDITSGHLARQIANARSRELELVLATVPAGVWFTYDVDARRVIRNRYANETLRNGETEVLGEDGNNPSKGRFAFFSDGRALTAQEMPLRHAMRGGKIQDREYEVRFWDGAARALLMSASPLRDEDGEVTGAVCVALDITGRKRDEDQKQLLLNELNHRVKNTLATVQSVAGQTLRTAPNKEAAQQILTQRLVALAKAHDVLTSENWEGAHLDDIVGGALAPYAERARFQTSGGRVWLTPALSLTFAMALHELITNAIKYGALSTPDGRIEMNWALTDEEPARLVFHWRESGGPPVTPPRHKGFGLRLLERSFSGNGGEVNIDYAEEGLSCCINVALAGRPRKHALKVSGGVGDGSA